MYSSYPQNQFYHQNQFYPKNQFYPQSYELQVRPRIYFYPRKSVMIPSISLLLVLNIANVVIEIIIQSGESYYSIYIFLFEYNSSIHLLSIFRCIIYWGNNFYSFNSSYYNRFMFDSSIL